MYVVCPRCGPEYSYINEGCPQEFTDLWLAQMWKDHVIQTCHWGCDIIEKEETEDTNLCV